MTTVSGKDPISFKGTRMGVLVSMSEEGSFFHNLELFQEKLEDNRQFFKGSPVSIDLGWREISDEELSALQRFFEKNAIALQGIISSSLATRKLAEKREIKVIIGRLGISEHYSRVARKEAADKEKKAVTPQEETLMLRKTVRAGQKLEYRGNMVIQGDVNPGAEVIATGDIIVLGALRGIAHAGAEGNESSAVTAFYLAPTQLRIARHMAIIKDMKMKKGCAATARFDNGRIVIFPYHGNR